MLVKHQCLAVTRKYWKIINKSDPLHHIFLFRFFHLNLICHQGLQLDNGNSSKNDSWITLSLRKLHTVSRYQVVLFSYQLYAISQNLLQNFKWIDVCFFEQFLLDIVLYQQVPHNSYFAVSAFLNILLVKSWESSQYLQQKVEISRIYFKFYIRFYLLTKGKGRFSRKLSFNVEL